MKFTTNHTEFFKEWRSGNVRKDLMRRSEYEKGKRKRRGGLL